MDSNGLRPQVVSDVFVFCPDLGAACWECIALLFSTSRYLKETHRFGEQNFQLHASSDYFNLQVPNLSS